MCRPGRRRSLLDRPASCRQALLVVVPRVGIDRRALADTREALPRRGGTVRRRPPAAQAGRSAARASQGRGGCGDPHHRYARRQRRAGRGPLVTAFHRCHPHVEVSIHEADLGDPTAGLRAGLVDIALTRAPFGNADGGRAGRHQAYGNARQPHPQRHHDTRTHAPSLTPARPPSTLGQSCPACGVPLGRPQRAGDAGGNVAAGRRIYAQAITSRQLRLRVLTHRIRRSGRVMALQ